ncbi:putative small lipoprotein YifL [Rhodoplanes tepidamans]|nr:putative small lipoprotein YifL [Rhodoplanes tepidamans]
MRTLALLLALLCGAATLAACGQPVPSDPAKGGIEGN